MTATFARSDLRRGGALYRSEWLSAVAKNAVEHHQSHAAGISSTTPLNSAEMAIADPDTAGFSLIRHRTLAVQSRLQPEPTEFDGQVGTHPSLAPTAAPQSISRFEKLANCGVGYFMRYVLGVNEVTDAAEITSIEALDKGNLVHGVLETLAQEWLDLDPTVRPPWLEGDHLAASLMRAEVLVDARAVPLRDENRLGHETAWRIERQMLVGAIGTTLRNERAALVEPVAVEHAFGPRDAFPAFEVATNSGAISFQGKIDRIERMSGRLSVTDFKTTTAAKPEQATPSASDPTSGGTKLQLPLYAAVAARDFANADDDLSDRHARYVYLRRSDSIADDLPDEAHEQFAIDLNTLANRMDQGDFQPSAPHALWGCRACSPDGLGLETVALRVGWWAAEQAATAATTQGAE